MPSPFPLTFSQCLTHMNQASFLWDIGKRWRPRSDATKCGIWSGSPLFAYTECSIKIWIKMKNTTQQPLKPKWTCLIDRGGTIQFGILFKWVKCDCRCLFVWFDSLHPIINLSVMSGRVFLGWTSTKHGLMFLFRTSRSADGEAWTRSHCTPYSVDVWMSVTLINGCVWGHGPYWWEPYNQTLVHSWLSHPLPTTSMLTLISLKF